MNNKEQKLRARKWLIDTADAFLESSPEVQEAILERLLEIIEQVTQENSRTVLTRFYELLKDESEQEEGA